jgi:AAA15 family ATPase/GTPase
MQKIIVENFGPIEYAEIELRDFVVLIGEQASGKSTLAKLVYFFNSLSVEFTSVASHTSTNDPKKFLEELAEATTKKFTKYFGFPGFLPQFKIRFYFSVKDDNYVELSINQKSPNQGAFHSSYSPSFIKGYNQHLHTLFNEINFPSSRDLRIIGDESDDIKEKKINSQVVMLKKTGDRIYNNRNECLFFPASRSITVQFSELFKQTFYGAIVSRLDSVQGVFAMSDSILMREFLDHVAILKDFIAPHKTFELAFENFKKSEEISNHQAIELFLSSYSKILKGKYSTNGDGERIFYGKESKSVLIEQASSGQQESLRILQDMFNVLILKLDVFRLIEEPESHLFPSAQKILIELFALVINTTPSQIFITTHSPYVLSVLANLLYAGKVNKLEAASIEEIESQTEINHLTWLDKEKFAAYTMDSGRAKSIFNLDDSGMIDQNYLDQISEELGSEFQVLHNIRLKQIREHRK